MCNMSQRIVENGVRNLLQVSVAEKRRFIDSFDHILADCDGTVWQMGGKIDGAGEAVERLKQRGKKLIYVTNNGIRSDDNILEMFAKSGISADLEEYMHPALAVIHYLGRIQFDGLIYVIGSPEFRQRLIDAGYRIIYGPYETNFTDFATFWATINDRQPVGAVVIDADLNLSIGQLMRAQQYLQRSPGDCLFLVGITDMTKTIGETSVMGAGPYYKMLEQATGRPATIVGKPGAALVDILLERYALEEPQRVLFVGDMIVQDIGFGNACGFQSLLVLTGTATLADLQTHPNAAELPAYYLKSFADFVRVLDDVEADGD